MSKQHANKRGSGNSGNLLDAKNKDYAEMYRNKLPRLFDHFAHQPGMVSVKMTPTFMVTMVSINDRLHLENLDLKNEIAYLKRLDEETK